jgi:hypothetical protein
MKCTVCECTNCTDGNHRRIATLEAENAKLRDEILEMRGQKPLETIYPDEAKIPVDRAGRKMYDKFGNKLDIEDREDALKDQSTDRK